MKTYNATKKAYAEITKALNKHKDLCVYDVRDLESKANCHLFGIELKEKHRLDLDPREVESLEYINFGDYRSIGLWGEKYRRTVSWLDDGEQPVDELLFVIGLSTGAYIFGDDYPTELFKEFWKELKSYGPKYCDTTNHNMYFSMDNASKIFNMFQTIFSKYQDKNREDFKARKIKKLKKEIANLEGKK